MAVTENSSKELSRLLAMARKTRQGHGCTWDASHQEVSKTALCKWKHALQLKLEEDERAGVSRGGTAFAGVLGQVASRVRLSLPERLLPGLAAAAGVIAAGRGWVEGWRLPGFCRWGLVVLLHQY